MLRCSRHRHKNLQESARTHRRPAVKTHVAVDTLCHLQIRGTCSPCRCLHRSGRTTAPIRGICRVMPWKRPLGPLFSLWRMIGVALSISPPCFSSAKFCHRYCKADIPNVRTGNTENGVKPRCFGGNLSHQMATYVCTEDNDDDDDGDGYVPTYGR